MAGRHLFDDSQTISASTSSGYVTITSVSGYFKNILVYVTAAGQPNLECLVTEVDTVNNKLGVQVRRSLGQGPSYGRTDVSLYTGGTLIRPEQYATGLTVQKSAGIVAVPAVVTGGTTTTVSGKEIHTFTSNGSLVVSGASVTVDYLLVGGGGAGGFQRGGGGGAGQVLVATSVVLAPGTYPIVIGDGGAATTGVGANAKHDGVASTFNGATAIGGGSGAGDVAGDFANQPGNTGGSGGGGTGSTASPPGAGGAGGTGTAGFNGGSGYTDNATYGYAGGGGGAGAVGANATSTTLGNGGDGITNAFSGASVYYGGGGGGSFGGTAPAALGTGGLGGGGNGPNSGLAGGAGTANTGGGGGGGAFGQSGGAGGLGIVIVRFTP